MAVKTWTGGRPDIEKSAYDEAAGQYEGVASRNLLSRLAGQTGGELSGTPGFLASQSVGPGGLARIRGRTLRSGMSRAAGQLGELQTGIAGQKLGFYGQLLQARQAQEAELKKMKYAKKLEGGGIGNVIKKIAGAGIGYLTGGPWGAVSSVASDIGSKPSGAYTPRVEDPYVSTPEDTYLRRKY